MNIRKIKGVIWGFGLVLCLLGCKSNETIELRVISHFEVEVIETTEAKVSLIITHDGSNRDAYMGILVVGNDKDATDSLERYCQQTLPSDRYKAAWFQRKRVITRSGLLPSTEYTMLVFAMDTAGTVLPQRKTVTFLTGEIKTKFYLDPSWKLDWKGEVLYKNDYWTEVDRTNLQDSSAVPAYVTLLSEEDYKQWGNISHAIYGLLSTYRSELADESVDWYTLPMVSRVNTRSFFQNTPGNYYAVAIGIEKDGSPTGRYAMSDLHSIEEYTALEGYSALLGSWRMTDATGVSNTVEITKNVVNRSVNISRWAGKNYSVVMKYNPNSKHPFYIMPQYVAYNVGFKDEDGNSFKGDIALLEWYMDADGNTLRAVEADTLAWCSPSGVSTTYTLNKTFYYTGLKDSDYGLKYYILTNDATKPIYTYTGTSLTFPIKLKKL